MKKLSLADYAASSAYDAAIKVSADSQIVLELGPADTRAFAKRILNPREPAELPELQAAVQQYRQDKN